MPMVFEPTSKPKILGLREGPEFMLGLYGAVGNEHR